MKPEFIVNRQGKDFVLYAGLLDQAHREGLKRITTKLLQAPAEENGDTAICWAEVETEKGIFTGIGDANAQNVGRMIAPHTIRMAETRAKARALRDAINVGVAAFEELGDDDAPASPQRPQVPPQRQETPPQRQQPARSGNGSPTPAAPPAPPAPRPAPTPAADPLPAVAEAPATAAQRKRIAELHDLIDAFHGPMPAVDGAITITSARHAQMVINELTGLLSSPLANPASDAGPAARRFILSAAKDLHDAGGDVPPIPPTMTRQEAWTLYQSLKGQLKARTPARTA